MMDIPLFDDSAKVPQPKDKIRIESLKVTPYPDRFRVFIEINVTPFHDRPNLILAMRNREGELIADLSIIETMHAAMEFTMHMRGVSDPAGHYILTADLFYENKNPPQDQREVEFEIPADTEG